MSTVAFIGAGEFGSRVARLVHAAGYRLVVCDRDERVTNSFDELGATTVTSGRDCARADVVIVFVATGEQVIDCLTGADGLLRGLTPASRPLVAIGSTVSPSIAIAVGATLKAAGVPTIDIPSTGALAFAERGELQILAGGELADIERARPVLATFSRMVTHCGDLGSGMKMKILNNLLSVSTIYLTAEAYRIGMEHGMPISAIATAINEGSGRNFWTSDIDDVARQYAAYTGDPAYYDTFLDITRKDLALACDLGREVNVRTPVLDVVAQRVASLEPTDEYDNMCAIARSRET